jgi:hypothetical protein
MPRFAQCTVNGLVSQVDQVETVCLTIINGNNFKAFVLSQDKIRETFFGLEREEEVTETVVVRVIFVAIVNDAEGFTTSID